MNFFFFGFVTFMVKKPAYSFLKKENTNDDMLEPDNRMLRFYTVGAHSFTLYGAWQILQIDGLILVQYPFLYFTLCNSE